MTQRGPAKEPAGWGAGDQSRQAGLEQQHAPFLEKVKGMLDADPAVMVLHNGKFVRVATFLKKTANHK